jgi:hypothetical protein
LSVPNGSPRRAEHQVTEPELVQRSSASLRILRFFHPIRLIASRNPTFLAAGADQTFSSSVTDGNSARFGNVGDADGDAVRRDVVKVGAVEVEPPGRWLVDPADDVEHGRPACAVGSDQLRPTSSIVNDRPLRDDATETHGDVLCNEHVTSPFLPPPRRSMSSAPLPDADRTVAVRDGRPGPLRWHTAQVPENTHQRGAPHRRRRTGRPLRPPRSTTMPCRSEPSTSHRYDPEGWRDLDDDDVVLSWQHRSTSPRW